MFRRPQGDSSFFVHIALLWFVFGSGVIHLQKSQNITSLKRKKFSLDCSTLYYDGYDSSHHTKEGDDNINNTILM